MLPFANFTDTGGLEYCWESHETFLEKSFHLNFLARAPVLQSVTWQSQNLVFTSMLNPQVVFREVNTDSKVGKESCSPVPSSSPNVCQESLDRNQLDLTLTPATFSEGW